MEKIEVDILSYINQYGINDLKNKLNEYSEKEIDDRVKYFENNNYLNSGRLTDIAFENLKEYKVDNAIIMAAGLSKRCLPLSSITPKGLYRVKGEIKKNSFII